MHVGGCGGRKVVASRRQAAPSSCPAPQNARTWTMGEPVSRLTHLALLVLLLAALLGHLPQVRSRTAPLPPPPAVFAPRATSVSHLAEQSADESRQPLQTVRRRWLSGSGPSAIFKSPTPTDARRAGTAFDSQIAQDRKPAFEQHHVLQRLPPEGFEPSLSPLARRQENPNNPVRPPWDFRGDLPLQSPRHLFVRTMPVGDWVQGNPASAGPLTEVNAQVTVRVPTAALKPFQLRPHLPLYEDLRKTLASKPVSPSPAATSGLVVLDILVLDSGPRNSTLALTVRGRAGVIRQLVNASRSELVASEAREEDRRRRKRNTSEAREEDEKEERDSETLPSGTRRRRSIRHMGMSYGMNGRIRTQMLAHRLSISYRHVQPCAYTDRFYCMNGGTCVFVGALDIKTCRCPIGYTGVRCELIDQEYILSLLTDSIIFS